jgi:hypothetical protein
VHRMTASHVQVTEARGLSPSSPGRSPQSHSGKDDCEVWWWVRHP